MNLIKISLKSDIFFNLIFISCFSEVMFFRVQVFQSPGFSGSSLFRIQVFQGPGYSWPRFFRVQVFQGPSSGSRSRLQNQPTNVPEKTSFPANIYLFKVNNRNQEKAELTRKTPKRLQKCRSGVFIVNNEHISHLFLVFLLLVLDR